jgi:hypothetical protein
LDLGDISKLAKKAVDEAKSEKTLKKLATDLVERVQKRTRLGRGVKKEEGPTHVLPRLKNKTINERKRLRRQGDLTGPGATPTKSGINRSGDTLESMHAEVDKGKIEIKLDAKGTKVARELETLDEGFTFMNLSSAEVKSAISFIERIINNVLKGQ